MSQHKKHKGKGKKYGEELATDCLREGLELRELNKGIIRIDEEIDSYSHSEISHRVDYLLDKRIKKITFLINSPGGDAYGGLALYDTIRNLHKYSIQTTGIVEGIAASAASMIVLQAMDQRLSMPNARFLIHEPRRWSMFLSERTSDMKDQTQEMVALTDTIYDIMAHRTGLKLSKLIKMIDRRECWLSAKEALDINLIDRII